MHTRITRTAQAVIQLAVSIAALLAAIGAIPQGDHLIALLLAIATGAKGTQDITGNGK